MEREGWDALKPHEMVELALYPAVPRQDLTDIARLLVDRFGSSPAAMKQAGIAYATDQIIDLFANGIRTVHVYSMNKPDVAAGIHANVSAVLGLPV